MGRSARARVADDVSRWLDWTEANGTIWLATLGRGEDKADPDVSDVVADLVRRAVALIAARHAEIAEDSPRLRHALECWTGLNRAATRRWLTGEATRDATHELIASTLEHVLRTFGPPPQTSSCEVAFDPWRAGQLAAELEREGILCTAFPQSDSRMIPASARLHAAVTERRLQLPDLEELHVHAANTIARHGRRGWRLDKPDERTPNDAIIALCMAVEAVENRPEPARVLGFVC